MARRTHGVLVVAIAITYSCPKKKLANMSDLGKKRPSKVIEYLQQLRVSEKSLHFSDFAEVTDTFMEGYARFSRLGLPDQTIALAMLGATINLCDMFGMRNDLPEIYRSLADKIESDRQAN